MPDSDKILTVVREWSAKADNDLKNAAHTLKLGKNCPTDTVCFHSQQCVEKYLKAFLVLLEIPFPKTHDVETLISRVPKGVRIPLSPVQQRRLTDYATVMRYPGSYEVIPLSEAKEAVKLARRIRLQIRRLLQKQPLF
jgi:HEPN domain-containing protein